MAVGCTTVVSGRYAGGLQLIRQLDLAVVAARLIQMPTHGPLLGHLSAPVQRKTQQGACGPTWGDLESVPNPESCVLQDDDRYDYQIQCPPANSGIK